MPFCMESFNTVIPDFVILGKIRKIEVLCRNLNHEYLFGYMSRVAFLGVNYFLICVYSLNRCSTILQMLGRLMSLHFLEALVSCLLTYHLWQFWSLESWQFLKVMALPRSSLWALALSPLTRIHQVKFCDAKWGSTIHFACILGK